MKKTFTVNISGQVFYMDEDAYDLLQQYLRSLKHHFSNKEGGNEIVEDIESRVAELMVERTSISKQAITLTDVNEIIAQLGQPIEMDDDTSQKEDTQSTFQSQFKGQKRFYRDSDHKVIGGVCSGIAAFFNLDPVIVRIAFAISFFIAGSSFWIYLILWVAIPEAKTTAEKLSMSGEPINVDNIEKRIKTEFDELKNRFGSMSIDAKDAVNNFRKNVQPKTTIENIVSIFGDILMGIGKVMGILFGIFFSFLGIAVLFVLMISLFSLNSSIEISSMGFHSSSIPQLLDLIIISSSSKTSAIIGIVIFIGLPMIMLVYSGIKLIFGWKYEVKYLGLSVFFLWLLGGILLAIVSFDLIRDFSKSNSINSSIAIQQPQTKVMFIDLATDSIPANIILDNESEGNLLTLITDKNERLYMGIPEIDFKVSDNDQYKVVIRKSARGKSHLEVRNRINSIEYSITQIGDTLMMNPIFSWSKTDVWRDQSVQITLFCPEGKTLFLKQNLLKINSFNHQSNIIDSFVNKPVGVDNNGLFVPIILDSVGKESIDTIK